ncbi:MAG: hypothetical protein JW768_01855 [Chitinispirillaceae bacterium]|nr:hypothetical protein [Chitinispirillaceae bacterium]
MDDGPYNDNRGFYRTCAIERLLKKGAYTPPATLEQELLTNPFLRLGEQEVRAHTGVMEGSPVRIKESCFG